MRPAVNSLLYFLLLASLLSCASGTVEAANTAALQLPTRPARPGRPPRPWLIEVDPSGIEGQAYRGLKITVTSHPVYGAVTRNHSLRVVVSSNGYGGNTYDERVTAYIEVPEGATTVTKIVDIPQRQQWGQIYVEFYEDGEPLTDCSTSFGLTRMNYRAWGDDTAGILVIDSDAPTRGEYRAIMATIATPGPEIKGQHDLPDVRWLLAAIPSNQTAGSNQQLFYTTQSFDDAQLLQTFATHEGIDLIPPSELSTSWLSQSNADLAIVSLDDLRLVAKSPERFTALQEWQMAGGTIVVYDCGDQWEHIDEMGKILGLPAQEPLPGDEKSPWRLPQLAKFRNEVEGVFDQNRGVTYDTTTGVPPVESGTEVKPTTDNLPFAYRRRGLGSLVAYRKNPFPGTPSDWGGLWNTLGAHQFLWSRRHGMSHHGQNADFWNFVIPGVGEAPVFSFMTMIALFMLLIGPINYYYLNRWRRLSLLLVTVPLGAGLFTLGLFSFAVLSDGFSTRTRVRSYTVLDVAQQRAATSSRQTYYTAFVPSDGLNYPTGTAVYPLHHSPYNEGTNGQFYQTDSEWLDDKLQLQRRYLAARQHRQFVVVRSTQCEARLEVQNKNGVLQVKNLLGTPIEYALIVDKQGALHVIENQAAGNVNAARAIEPSSARGTWIAQLAGKSPTMPVNYDPNRYDNIFSLQRSYGYRYGWGQNSGWVPTQSMSVLERGINEVGPRLVSQATNRPNQYNLEPQSFIAITKDAIDASDGRSMAPLGVRGSNVVESLHVVKGNW